MTVITQLPTPPSRKEPVPFSERTDAFLGAMPTFVTETNAVASEVNADRVTAVNSAATAVTKAAEAEASAQSAAIANTATKWVSGTTYAEGIAVWSPLNYFAYRRKTAGAGTTDPSLDTTNWGLIGFDPATVSTHAALTSGVHGLGTASQKNSPATGNDATATEVVLGSDTRLSDARTPVSHTIGSHSDVDVVLADIASRQMAITYYAYTSRANIRSLTPVTNDRVLIEGLGEFRWVSGSTEYDDDETCFATASGRWLVETVGPELSYALALIG